MRELYILYFYSKFGCDLVTLRIKCNLEARFSSLSILFETVKFIGRRIVQILQEEEITSLGGRLIRSFGGSPRVANQ